MKTGKIFLIAVAFTSSLFVACQPEEEGTTPADARDLYVDSWAVSENSSQIGNTNYTVHINKVTTNTSQVEIENFYNIGFTFKAKVNIDGSSMNIPLQTYNGNQLHGSGTKNGANSISMTYYVDNGTTVDTCTATLARQ